VQGAAWTGRFAGMALTSLIVPLLGPRVGWTPVLLFLGLCALVQAGFALMIREIPGPGALNTQEESIKNILPRVFSQPVIWYGLLFMLFFFASRGFSNLINIYLLTELGWSSSPETMQLFGLSNIIQLVGSALGAALVIRIPHRLLMSFKFFTAYTVIFWILILPWLCIHNDPDEMGWIAAARLLFGFGLGVGMGLGLAIAMRLCPKFLEGFMFAVMVSAQNFGDLTIAPKTITAFMETMGGLVPAFFSLVPYSILALLCLRPVLRALQAGGAVPAPKPA
jgi:MFS family permease